MIPEHIREIAAQVARQSKIFMGFPNLLWDQAYLKQWLIQAGSRWTGRLSFLNRTEDRFHDFARNQIVEQFLASDADYLYMNDSDVNPHPDILALADRDKPVIAGNVFCYTKGELMPSIWRRAPCEQCAAWDRFEKTGKLDDLTEWRLGPISNKPEIWDPIIARWRPYHKTGCRCGCSGRDPFVYRVHPDVFNVRGVMECDSVGAAAIMIRRDVFAKLERPYFSFLYKPSRQIMMTEDHYFCWKAKEAGFSIWADTTMACQHFKTIDLLAVNELCVRAYNFGVGEGRRAAQLEAQPIPGVPA